MNSSITIFNYQFPHLEDPEFINAKFAVYYDFHNLMNEARVMAGRHEKELKHDAKIEHDLYLREAVITLRRDKNKIDNIDYICLTLDKSLIKFDNYANGLVHIPGQDKSAPNFILPSFFLRRIRSFLPIVTDDYRKAFIASITANTYDLSTQDKSIAVQRSMTYFKKLGIEDTELISSVIKKELFFKDFSMSEKNSTQESFLRSEVDREFERIRQERTELDGKIQHLERGHNAAIQEGHQKSVKLETELSVVTAKHLEEQKITAKQRKQLLDKDKTIEQQQFLSVIQSNETSLREKRQSISILDPIKTQLDQRAENFFGMIKCLVIFVLLVFWVASFIVTFWWGVKWLLIVSWICTAVVTLVPIIYTVVYEKEWNNMLVFKYTRQRVHNRYYRHNSFSIRNYEELQLEIEKLDAEIVESKNTYKIRSREETEE